MNEIFGPEYVRPPQQACPNCPCCSAELCERGRVTVTRCAGKTPEEHRAVVAECPCSDETTPGTAAWHVARVRVTRHALERPMAAEVEQLLRVIAAGDPADAPIGLLRELTLRRYVAYADLQLRLTVLGRAYLVGRDEVRRATPILVLDVDERERTARVIVTGWSSEDPVTVHLDQLVAATGVPAGDLPGKLAEASANCDTAEADDVVLTGIRIARALVQSWTGPTGGDE